MSVTEKVTQNSFCQKRLFLEFGPLKFGLKYEIAEDIYSNYVTYVEKLVVLLKDLHMKFISDVKPNLIKAL